MESSKATLRPAVDHGFIEADDSQFHDRGPSLVLNDSAMTMGGVLRAELERADSFQFSVAFVTTDGIGTITQQLSQFKGKGTIVTSDYQDFNEPDALRELLKFDHIEARILVGKPHHAKGYIFHHSDHLTALVGSSNLTRNALLSNNEWNLKFSSHDDGDIAIQLSKAVKWQRENSIVLTEDWIDQYEKRRKKRTVIFDDVSQPISLSDDGEEILPNLMQTEALENLQRVIDAGERRAIIISATGTGKTILSALAVRQIKPRRVLFVAHREQILNKAAEEFQRVLACPPTDIGFIVGQRKEANQRLVFATIQSLSRGDTLSDISPEQFDLVIVDEVHRSGAESYQKVLNHFRADFTLGLTATPERTDGFNVFELFDYNVPYEIRLEGALENHMLVPFDYYGVSDYESAFGSVISDNSTLEQLADPERVHHLAKIIQDYSFARDSKGLIFCSSNAEAAALSKGLNAESVHGRPLRTIALSGGDSIETRENAVEKLAHGEIDYILTVDIFNEGIDIPPVNMVVMLRSTQSSIVFTQQLGRGLRKYAGKRSLRVIDVIGNYATNFLIAVALTGDRSGSKDVIKEGLHRTRTHPLAGASTVSFDRVSMQRIVESLQKARIADRKAKREAILNLQYRLGRIPSLVDFENHESMNPFILAATDNNASNYWSLLNALKFVETPPSSHEAAVLSMLSIELLNGKRPHELLLLRALIENGPISVDSFRNSLQRQGLDASAKHLESVERILNLSWFVKATAQKYGSKPIVERVGDQYRLGREFTSLYGSYAAEHPHPEMSFRAHVDDILATGLLINRKHYGSGDRLLPGKLYSRKDACRLLNWKQNAESTIMGYKVDKHSGTCPIFVTYHKDPDVDTRLQYGDHLVNRSTMHWFSRHGRTLESKELQPILSNSVELHLFVKREDADGLEFHYLGQADSTDAQNTTMRGNNGDYLDVVTTDLILHHPIPQEIFDAITASKTVASVAVPHTTS